MTKTIPLSDDVTFPIVDGDVDLYDALSGAYDVDVVSPNDFDRLQALFDEVCQDCGYHPDDDMDQACNELLVRIIEGLR